MGLKMSFMVLAKMREDGDADAQRLGYGWVKWVLAVVFILSFWIWW